MINKIYKTIHNKYLKFFKFFFFLRYVFIIFSVAIILFLTIPKLFNYEKKQEPITKFLTSYYNLEIKDFKSIKYNIFPTPNLLITDVNLKTQNDSLSIQLKKINIFLSLKNIYDFKDLKPNKIKLTDIKANVDIDNAIAVIEYLDKMKHKIDINNLKLVFFKNQETIIKIEKIRYKNYGNKKDQISGIIFGNEFKFTFKDNLQKLNFELVDTGIYAKFFLDKYSNTSSFSGNSKITILDTYAKFDFTKKNNLIKISNSNLKNKDLFIVFDSSIKLKPFFEINSNILIKKIRKKLVKSIKLEKIFDNKEIIKKINSYTVIDYSKPNLVNSFITDSNLKLSLAHGKLVYSNKILFTGGFFECVGDSFLSEEYPRLIFNCIININDRKKFIKYFSLSDKFNENKYQLTASGSLNILNNKINFTKINLNKNYIMKEEELNYFKQLFEKFLFDEGFVEIFEKRKIENFLKEFL